MHGSTERPLQNVLSISTAANNRYLLHFNSINSLTQWTAGIRLSMYEHATLQEAYTGSLIAGKGKLLNNIRAILEQSRYPYEDWVRVRFGAGTPWRRCWCVITPPDEKEYAKAAKAAKKKNSYSRKVVIPKGDIKFYEAQKVTKKTKPIATISDAFAAYAIYPQSKPLIDQSTLIKLEGLITIHTPVESTSEAFIFIMPEAHTGISGFEMLLRWLFRCYDTLVLYGRPTRLIADTRDQRGLMFAMPIDRRYGYLDDIDVSALIHTEGSQAWTERQWRMEMKKCTAHKMEIAGGDSGRMSPARTSRIRASSRASLPSMGAAAVRFNDGHESDSSTGERKSSLAADTDDTIRVPKRVNTEPANPVPYSPSHNRSVSEAIGLRRNNPISPIETRGNGSPQKPLRSPQYPGPIGRKAVPTLARVQSEYEGPSTPITEPFEELNINADRPPVTPVVSPPAFIHNANAKPSTAPYQAPELRRATSEMDTATLVQMKEANNAEGRVNTQEEMPAVQHEVSTDLTQRPMGVTDDSATAGLPYHPVVNSIAATTAVNTAANATSSGHQLSPLQQTEPLSAVQESSIPSTPHSAGIDQDLLNSEALDRVLDDDTSNIYEPSRYDQLASARPVRERDTEQEGRRVGRLRVTGDANTQPQTAEADSKSGLREALNINFDAPTSTSGHGMPSKAESDMSPTDGEYHDALQSPPSAVSPADIAVAYGSPEEDVVPAARSGHRPGNSAVRQSLTPEEWVQHRAAVAIQAGPPARAMKNRVSSVPTIQTDHKMTSPRMSSAGWDRPSPRVWSPADYPSAQNSAPTLIEQADSRRLSAQSRMQAARVGGSPLLAMNPDRQHERSYSPANGQGQGLYGALQVREDVQRANKASFQNPGTQQAMAASQYQQNLAMQAAQAAQANQAKTNYQNQQAAHAAQMANYQAFLRQQQQAQVGMQVPGQAQYGRNSPHSPGSPYRVASPNGQMQSHGRLSPSGQMRPPNHGQDSYSSSYSQQ